MKCSHELRRKTMTIERWKDVGGFVFPVIVSRCPDCGKDIEHLRLVDVEATKIKIKQAAEAL